jgi:hypothetical protein
MTVSVSGTGTSNLSAAQFTLALPSGVSAGTPTITPTLGSANYQFGCGPSSLICLIAPIGAFSPLADGTLATIPLTFSSTVPLGNQSITLNSIFTADKNGMSINGTIAGSPYVVKVVPSPCDLNGDGTINVVDVQIAFSAVIGTGACPISLANGGCTAGTVVQEVLAALGGACKVP